MEKKVVVMSAQDVAQMRKAHKEAEKAYFQAKVGALEFAVAEMSANAGKEYTLHELTAMTGLSSMEIVVQLNPNSYCKAAAEAGVRRQRIRTGRRVTERNFIEVMPDGKVNPNSIMTVTRWESTYQIPEEKVARR